MDGVCIGVHIFFLFLFLFEKFVWLVQITTPFDNKDLFLEGEEEDKKKRRKKNSKETIKTFNDNILRIEE